MLFCRRKVCIVEGRSDIIIVEKLLHRSVKVKLLLCITLPMPITITRDVAKAGNVVRTSRQQFLLELEPSSKIISKKQENHNIRAEQEEEWKKIKQKVKEKEMEKAQWILTINKVKYQSSPEEIALLKRVVYAESRGSSTEEQMATTETILNRAVTRNLTITEVLKQKGQFQCVKSDGNVYTGLEPNLVLVTDERVTEQVSNAVDEAIYGENDITEDLLREEALRLGLDPEIYADGGAIYFYEPDPKIVSEKELASRASIKVKVKIGEGEHFYYKVWDK